MLKHLVWLVVACTLAGVQTGCDPFLGTQGMPVHTDEFTNGTTRHPAPWDSALAPLERCAQTFVEHLPAPADSLGGSPALPEPITAPLDTLLRGGIWVLGKLTDDTASHVGRAWDRADAVYQDSVRRLFITTHAYRLRDEVQHEFAHALADYYPALRDPPGVVSAARRNDHDSPFFRACVTYNPSALQ